MKSFLRPLIRPLMDRNSSSESSPSRCKSPICISNCCWFASRSSRPQYRALIQTIRTAATKKATIRTSQKTVVSCSSSPNCPPILPLTISAFQRNEQTLICDANRERSPLFHIIFSGLRYCKGRFFLTSRKPEICMKNSLKNVSTVAFVSTTHLFLSSECPIPAADSITFCLFRSNTSNVKVHRIRGPDCTVHVLRKSPCERCVFGFLRRCFKILLG